MHTKFQKVKDIPQILAFILFAFWLKYFLRIKVNEVEEITAEKPVIFVSNHRSKLDPFVILSALGWRKFIMFCPWRFPLAKNHAEKWWLGGPARLVGCYKIEGKGDLEKSLKDTFSSINGGFSLIFFPEGKMVREGEHVEPKKGIGYICQKKDVSLIPVKIEHNGFDKKGRGRLRGARVIFGDVFNSRDLRGQNKSKNLHLRVMEKINELE